MRQKFMALALAAVVAAPSLAGASDIDEDWSACGVDKAGIEAETFPKIAGTWTVNNQAGHSVVQAQGHSMAVPMPAEPPEDVDFVLDGTTGMRALRWGDDDTLEYDVTILEGETILDAALDFIPNGKSKLSEDELGLVVACETEDLPKLVMGGNMDLPEGNKMTWESNLIVVSAKTMYGASRFNISGPDGVITGYRLVTLTR